MCIRDSQRRVRGRHTVSMDNYRRTFNSRERPQSQVDLTPWRGTPLPQWPGTGVTPRSDWGQQLLLTLGRERERSAHRPLEMARGYVAQLHGVDGASRQVGMDDAEAAVTCVGDRLRAEEDFRKGQMRERCDAATVDGGWELAREPRPTGWYMAQTAPRTWPQASPDQLWDKYKRL
eukprot:TRINITY_DN44610_c0_g1_i1.p1 TRINITY_DN44610_c0_g1~~TRINITY_DN44610_c0_g1_i1.p1  ORF type:complete len:176 (+),score=29.06 TRINITY_DN44610_c0_g1_i1:139-666(+)